MKKITSRVFLGLVATFLIAPSFVLAEVDPNGKPLVEKEYPALDVPSWNIDSSASGNATCFDYYKFQSVQVLIGASKENFIPGEKITLSGSVVNRNDYPVVDGYVFARVTQDNSVNVADGNFIVDEFFALEKVSLDAKESKSVSFNWTVPQSATNGKYKIDYFFSVGKKFNLGGLPFSNEVITGFSSFNVVTTNNSAISFNRTETKVNGEKYFHIGNWPVFAKGEKVTITQPIKNTSNKTKQVDVVYDLYYWDSLNSADKISTKDEVVEVAAGGAKTLSYVIDQMNDSVYMVKITATSEGQKSIVNIRLTSNQEHPRLNYPAITKFPLEKNDKVTLFSCYHNSSNIDTTGRVVVTLLDQSGKEIGKIDYSGAIPSAMSASKQEVTATDKYTYLKLVADLFNKDGKKIDSYETVYDCKTLQSEKCKRMEVVPIPESSTKSNIDYKTIGLLVALAVILGIVLIVLKKRGKKSEGVTTFMLLLAISFAAFGFNTNKAEAIYNERNPTTYGHYSQYWFNYCNKGESQNDDIRHVTSSNITVTHSIGMTAGSLDAETNDVLSFDYGQPVLFFSSSDGVWDTPYGKWCNTWDSECVHARTAGPTYVTHGGDGGAHQYWSAWSAVKPATFTLSSSDSNIITCSGTSCTAVAQGTAEITATIPRTVIVPWTYMTFTAMEGWLFRGVNSDFGHRLCGGDDRPCADDCKTGGNMRWASLPVAHASWTVTVKTKTICGDGKKEGDEECDNGTTVGNGACPLKCSAECRNNLECPCVGAGCACTGAGCGGGPGSSCSVSTDCQTGLCCDDSSKTCSANCKGNEGQCGAAVPGKVCCSDKTWRTDCACALEPSNANQKCCTVDGIWRERCTGCTRDNQCATSRAECCSEEYGTCTTDKAYCVDADFSLDGAEDIVIYLTANKEDHAGSTRVRVTPAGGFHKDVTLSPVSTSPDDNLKNKMLNWSKDMFNPNPLSSDKYRQGSIVTVKVPYNIIPAGTSKTYEMTIKGVANAIEKIRTIRVKIYGQGWSQP